MSRGAVYSWAGIGWAAANIRNRTQRGERLTLCVLVHFYI